MNKVSVSDIANIYIGGTPDTTIKKYWDGDIYWASAKDISNCKSRYIESTEKKITLEAIKNSAAKMLPKNTIVVTSRGTVGKICLLPFSMSFYQTCYGLVAKEGIEPLFLFYKLKSLFEQINQLSYGTVFSTITIKNFNDLIFNLPSMEEQKAIAHILGTLDDKIELNKKMNETLEAMARAIFKSWFVDFDPVRAKAEGRDTGLPKWIADLFPKSLENSELGSIPYEWKIKSLYSCAEFINGSAFKDEDFSSNQSGLPIVKIVELKNGITVQTKFTNKHIESKYIINDGDILFSWSGSPDTSIDIFIWAGGLACLNQHIFKVIPYQTGERSFIYFLLRFLKPMFIEIARNKQTTGLGHVTSQDMKEIPVVFPQNNIIERFDNILRNIFLFSIIHHSINHSYQFHSLWSLLITHRTQPPRGCLCNHARI